MGTRILSGCVSMYVKCVCRVGQRKIGVSSGNDYMVNVRNILLPSHKYLKVFFCVSFCILIVQKVSTCRSDAWRNGRIVSWDICHNTKSSINKKMIETILNLATCYGWLRLGANLWFSVIVVRP